ncbi:MAG: hypothetical protein ACREIA_12330 [Opitutaceae bacterium]
MVDLARVLGGEVLARKLAEALGDADQAEELTKLLLARTSLIARTEPDFFRSFLEMLHTKSAEIEERLGLPGAHTRALNQEIAAHSPPHQEERRARKRAHH